MSECKGNCCRPVINQFYGCGCCGSQGEEGSGSGTGVTEWKLLDKVKGKTPVVLPKEYKELYIHVRYEYSKLDPTATHISVPFYILRENLTEKTDYYELGAYHLPTSNEVASLLMNEKQVELHMTAYNEIEKSDTTEISVYYR